MFQFRPFVRNSLLIFALALIPVLLLSINQLLARQFEQSNWLAGEIERSHQRRAHLRNVLSLHQDIEIGQRGFVLTADPDFLEPYEQGLRDVDAVFVRLRSLNPEQGRISEAIPELETLSARQIDLSTEAIELTRAGRRDEAVAVVAGGRSNVLMDAIRSAIARMDAIESRALALRTEAAEEARGATRRMAYRLQAVLALLLLVSASTMIRSLAARRRAMERYRDISARQDAVFAGAKDAMLILDEDGRIESANIAAVRLYGYRRRELVGRNVAMLFADPPKDEDVARYLSSLHAREGDKQGRVQEFDGRRRNGATFPIEVATSPVRLAEGTCYLSTIRDVTERKQIEQMKVEFVSTVSHELRTPLTSIAGSLGLLAGGAAGAMPERPARLIEIAHSNSQRLVRLINDILDIEKLDSGRMTFDLKWVPLRPLLEQAIQANRGFAEAYDVEILLEEAPAEALVVADEDRLMQVVTNLLSNAVKFSPAGETVTVRAETQGNHYRICVADRGPGIPESFQAHIFGRFAQADSSDSRQKGGTGLGLSIAREIVVRLGGSIGFETAPGAGTTFFVDLPAGAGPELEDRSSAETGESRSALARIIHADDDPDTLRLVASAFEGKAELYSTPSVREAHASLLRRRFDAAILDISMADGSGLDLLPLLRRSDHPVPTVLFTVHDATPALMAQVDAVVTKSRSTLNDLVAEVMSRLPHRSRAETEARM